MGALSVTWEPHYREPFEPLIPGVSFVQASDLSELDRLVDAGTAAIIVEPIQGEGGVRPISEEAARAIAAACARSGALLIADEVQSGSGRTGAFLYSPTIGLKPDLIALGKALGGGMPVGAAMISERLSTARLATMARPTAATCSPAARRSWCSTNSTAACRRPCAEPRRTCSPGWPRCARATRRSWMCEARG
jgi:acetylornithine/succinyldiaminopimelate/putrescine aminotransferase